MPPDGDLVAEMELFGSMWQSMALETSDIDVVVTGVDCKGDPEIWKQKLELLHQAFVDSVAKEFIPKCDFISGASMPLIKMEFNVTGGVSFGHSIEVDISIDDVSNPYHSGI